MRKPQPSTAGQRQRAFTRAELLVVLAVLALLALVVLPALAKFGFVPLAIPR